MKRIAHKTLAWIAAGALATGIAAPASAEGLGFYAGAGVGVVSLDSTDVTVIGAFDSKDTGFKGVFGLQLDDSMAMEIAVQTLGEFGNATPTFKTDAVSLWLVGSLPMTQNLALQGKIGPTVFRSDIGGQTDTGGSISFGLGFDYRLLSNLHVAYEYERHQAKVFAVDSSYDVFSVGLKYHF